MIFLLSQRLRDDKKERGKLFVYIDIRRQLFFMYGHVLVGRNPWQTVLAVTGLERATLPIPNWHRNRRGVSTIVSDVFFWVCLRSKMECNGEGIRPRHGLINHGILLS
jgi:hypothetical protein